MERWGDAPTALGCFPAWLGSVTIPVVPRHAAFIPKIHIYTLLSEKRGCWAVHPKIWPRVGAGSEAWPAAGCSVAARCAFRRPLLRTPDGIFQLQALYLIDERESEGKRCSYQHKRQPSAPALPACTPRGWWLHPIPAIMPVGVF